MDSPTTAAPGPCHRFEPRLRHLLEVNQATHCLLPLLDCDGWYVVCRHDHQLVIRLTKASVPKYAVCYQCRPDVEKAVYHGSRAWALWLIPLSSEDNLSAAQAANLQAALAAL